MFGEGEARNKKPGKTKRRPLSTYSHLSWQIKLAIQSTFGVLGFSSYITFKIIEKKGNQINLTKECRKSHINLGIWESHINRSMSRVNPNPITSLTCSLVHPSHPLPRGKCASEIQLALRKRKLFQHIFLYVADLTHCHSIPCQVLYFKSCIPEVKINTIQP